MEDAVGVFADLAYYTFGDKAIQEENSSYNSGYSIATSENNEPDDLDTLLKANEIQSPGLEGLDLGV